MQIDEVRYIVMVYISVYFVSLVCEICVLGGVFVFVLYFVFVFGVYFFFFVIFCLSLFIYIGIVLFMVIVVDFVVQLYSFVFFM